MKVKEFDFNLPEELIAQHPLKDRDHSRLMVLNRNDKTIEHKHFYDIIDYFNKGDILVLNNSKVIPARLYGIKEETHAKIEILLLKELDRKDVWEVLVKPFRRVKEGTIVKFSDELLLKVLKLKGAGICEVKLIYDGILIEILEKLGTMPLPPYIKERLKEQNRYQTIYAKDLGSAAAPTAGFHFTKELLAKIRKKGVEILEITLHVGLGTFRPVSVDDVLDHHMHFETYYITEEVAERLNKAKNQHKKIFAVGTTTVRTLESNFDGKFHSGVYETDIFIYPGYKFMTIDHLITNFHLPKSTLLMLVSAFYSKEEILRAYEVAIKNRYRFFSFGDSMLIY